MAQSVGASAGTVAWVVERSQAIWAIATLLAWTHTLDEMRIGEFIAVPFGVINAVLVATWPQYSRRGKAATAIAFGLFWGLAVVPYHIAPLLSGVVTWQNISGVTRLVAGVLMVALGISIALRRDTEPSGPVSE